MVCSIKYMYKFEIESTVIRSGRNETSWHVRSLRFQQLEAELLRRYTELDEFGLVDAYCIVVGLRRVSHGVPEIPNDRVLGLDGLLHLLADLVYSVLVEAGPLDQLSELNVLALELSLSDGQDLIED